MDHSELKGALLTLLRDDADVRAALAQAVGEVLEQSRTIQERSSDARGMQLLDLAVEAVAFRLRTP
jgi:hypothetical protein